MVNVTSGSSSELSLGAHTIAAQQSFVLPLPDGRYLWAGDRWQSAGDGFKSHDYQAWVPMEFDSNGTIMPLQWLKDWTLELGTAQLLSALDRTSYI